LTQKGADEYPILISFCQRSQKTIKNACHHKKSVHQDMVCLFK
jgi:hypothetical protein